MAISYQMIHHLRLMEEALNKNNMHGRIDFST